MFNLKNLILTAYAGSFSLFAYRTEDKAADVLKTGYLTSSHIRAGDAVLVYAKDKTMLCEVVKESDKLKLKIISGSSGKAFEAQEAIADLPFKEIPANAPNLSKEVNERLKSVTETVNNILITLRTIGITKE